MPTRTTLAAATALAGLLAAPAAGLAPSQAAPMSDGQWVAVSGEIVAVGEQVFTIEHGDGLLTVEFDDFVPTDEVDRFSTGMQVTVYGPVDNDLYERRTLEAATVWSEATDTYHYASPVDEEDTRFPSYAVASQIADDGRTTITVSGEVSAVEGRELEIDIGARRMSVDTSGLPHDPTDEVGRPQVSEGDRVQVFGALTGSFFDERSMVAERLTLISDESRR